jgi:putative ABC transport system permease protein
MTRIRYAIRSLAKAPLLSLVVVLSLGLGIGANTAIFSLLNQIVLSSLPVQKPEELVLLNAPGDFKGGRSSTNDSGDMDFIFSYPFFRELEKHSEGVAGLAAFDNLGANLAFGNQTIPGSFDVVSGQYFPTLGVTPLIGRTITPEDDRHGGGNAVAVLGFGYWKDKLGGRTDVLNQPLRLNGQVLTIVGVLPKDFHGTTIGQEPDAYVPLSLKPLLTPNWNGTDRKDDYWLYLFARLKPGTTRQQAAAALNSTYASLVEEHSKQVRFRDPKRIQRYRESRLTLIPGRQGNSGTRDDRRTPLLILMGATAMVLLIAMANAANLLLARSAQRKREMAIRAAMGAGRGELMGQLLTEALLLASAGGLAGLFLGQLTLKLLVAQIGGDDPVYYVNSQIDWQVVLFAVGLSLATGLLFGLYPAWDGARASLAMTLKDESGNSSGTAGTARIRKALVCAQVGISAILLIPTGLFLKSLVNLLHVNLGMKTENVIGFRISPSLNSYKDAQSRALFERAEEQLAAIPGARSVAVSLVPLISGSNWGNDVRVEGASPGVMNNSNARFTEVGPGYFGKLGIPLIAGREFTMADTLGAPKVAVVNEQFVKAFLEGRNPIGVRFGSGTPDTEIVGVVKDSHYAGVKQAPPKLYFTPWRQDPKVNGLSFYVRTAVPPAQMTPQIRRVMRALDADLPLENLRTLDEQIRFNIRNDRIVLQLAAAFAILATALAMLGLYGVMAHSVTRRTREIGIRIALGAAPLRIRTMVLREMLWILGIGLVIGVPAAMFLARLTESQLYGVKTRDLMVVAGAVLALAATAIAAAYLPARRASRVNPLSALRYE